MVHPAIKNSSEAAKRVIEEHPQLHLSVADCGVFIQALLNPLKPIDKLLKAAKKYKKGMVSK